jgi:hypothetical protein
MVLPFFIFLYFYCGGSFVKHLNLKATSVVPVASGITGIVEIIAVSVSLSGYLESKISACTVM